MGQVSSRVEAAGGSIAAVAVTPTFSQMAFAQHTGVPFPLLSDWGGRVARAYGVLYDEWKGHTEVAKRSVFVIDGERTIRYSWVTDDALVLPPLSEAVDVLEAVSREQKGPK